MPYTIGPFTATSIPSVTSGTAFAVPIDRTAQAIQVHNDTPFRLYILLDGVKPTAQDSLAGNYTGVAAPWSHPVVPIQRSAASSAERATNAIRDFQGTVWIMPIDVTAALAQNGTISALREVHLDVYLPGEQWPQAWAVPRQQDTTSQQRVVTVPISASINYVGAWTASTSTPLTLGDTGYSNANLNNGGTAFYLYYVVLSIIPQSVLSETDLTLQAFVVNGSGVQLTFPAQSLLRVGLASSPNTAGNNPSGGAFVFAPPVLPQMGFTAPNSAFGVRLQLVANAIVGAPVVAYTIACGVDRTNASAVPSVGASPWNPTSATNPLIY